LSMAAQAMDLYSDKERSMYAHVSALNDENFKAARRILDKALGEISALDNRGPESTKVYYFGLMGFPLTK
jgi:hypothetical protein